MQASDPVHAAEMTEPRHNCSWRGTDGLMRGVVLDGIP